MTWSMHSQVIYIVLPNLPWLGVTNAVGASHVVVGIIGSISHTQHPPYPQPPMSYGQPQMGTSFAYTYPPPDISRVNA